MAAACLQTAAMPHPLRPETDRSSYTNQPPTWQPHAFRQLPPGLRKPSKEHFLIFHRYSTELFRGWACLLDFCKPLANMGPCKMVNVSAFGTPSLLKWWMFQLFAKRGYATRYSSYIYIYVISKNKNLGFLQNTICNLDMPHDIPHIYISFCEIKWIWYATRYSSYICVFEAILCFICHTIFHIYIYI